MPLFGGSAGAVIPLVTPNTNFNGTGVTGAYKSALTQNAEDYDRIRQGYESLLSSPKSTPYNYTPLTPTFRNYMQGPQYQESPGYQDTMSGLTEFSKTGGFNDVDLAALRARGTAPIRSAYATALKELNRQKSLSGGQLPNQAAALAKFAREKGYLLSDQATNINAALAEKIAGNKLSSLTALAPLQANEANQRNEFALNETRRKDSAEAYNTDLINEMNKLNLSEKEKIDQLNREEEQRYLDNQNRALQSMQSLYSASPGLVNTFGSQVLADRNQTLQNNSQRASQGLQLISQLQRPGYGGVTVPRFG